MKISLALLLAIVPLSTSTVMAKKPASTRSSSEAASSSNTVVNWPLEISGPEGTAVVYQPQPDSLQLTIEELDSLRPQSRVGKDSRELFAGEAVTWAERHLFERRSVLYEHELWRHALEAARGSSTSLKEIKQETTSRQYLRSGENKVAHRDVLAREWKIVQAARDGIGAYAPLSPRLAGADSELTPEQSTALDSVVWSADSITLFRGGAGTGKSFVLKRVQQALDAAGTVSLVLAPQRQQVIDLKRDGLTGTATVAECLQRGDLPDRAVVIVDEAGQLSGRQLFDLIDLVRERRGRLILSGDTRQHGPVEASDALRAIERYSGLRAAEISEIRRQDARRGRTMAERKRIKTYREAVEAAAAGDLSCSFRKLEALGAIVECDPAGQNECLTNAYLEIAKSGESAIVISQTRAEVRAVNDAIREQLRNRGLLAGGESAVTALESRSDRSTEAGLATLSFRECRRFQSRFPQLHPRGVRQDNRAYGKTSRH